MPIAINDRTANLFHVERRVSLDVELAGIADETPVEFRSGRP